MDRVVTIVLLYLGIKDIRERELSLRGLFGVLLLGVLVDLKTAQWKLLVLGSLPGLVLCLLSFLFPQEIGLGDGILAIGYGLAYGWKRTCIWLMIGLMLAAVFGSIYYMIRRKRHIELPFVPFLFITHIGLCL